MQNGNKSLKNGNKCWVIIWTHKAIIPGFQEDNMYELALMFSSLGSTSPLHFLDKCIFQLFKEIEI